MVEEEKTVKIPPIVSVGEFADLLAVPVSKVIGEMMKNGVMATINENIDFETAEIIAELLDFKVELAVDEKPSGETSSVVIDSKNVVMRPPVVAVMGHVDHGKTKLLDAIRKTDVVAGESGGITQHIGAYQVEVKGRKITFLDTPGHEAFDAMRAHGAKVTDIAIIVIAADDGIKPQTTEAINHAKEANTCILVALNKIDKPDADPTRVKQQLVEVGLNPQEWGGDTEVVEISAKESKGIDKLLETIITMADLLELKADPTVPAQGVVIESNMEIGKGAVATVLIQNGTLRAGDWVVVGENCARVRSMEDEHGKKLKEVLPGAPAKISGLKSVPQVADLLQVYADEKEAKTAAQKSQKYSNVKKISSVKKSMLEALSESFAQSEKNELNLVAKADVVGSLDAIKESLTKIGTKDVGVKFVGEGVGDISESDVSMAEVSDKIIVGFKVGVASGINALAKSKAVKIIRYDVIYELIDDVRKLLSDMMPIERTEIPVGHLKVLAIFKSSPQKTVVGGKVEEGRAEKDVEVRVKRGGDTIENYHVTSIHKAKEEVASMPQGSECGVGFDFKANIVEGDVLEFYRVEEHKKSLM